MPHASTSVPRDALRLTPGVETLGIESAFEVAAAARCLETQGRSVVHAEIGEPDGPTPAHIVEAGVRALRDGATRYAAPAGVAALREAWFIRKSVSRMVRRLRTSSRRVSVPCATAPRGTRRPRASPRCVRRSPRTSAIAACPRQPSR